jgi:spore coat assembly protein
VTIKPGDIVGRKSYGCDVIFKVCDIEENRSEGKTVLLKGINVRLLADSPETDLVLMSEEEVEKDRQVFARRFKASGKIMTSKKRGSLSRQGSYGFMQPGRVLHLDGDSEYLKLCLKEYEKMGIKAFGYEIREEEQYKHIKRLLRETKPDILVVTGHDGLLKDSKDLDDINSYRNSYSFIQSVKEAREVQPSLDELIIIAGACQSHYEAILEAGANFASSPNRILIHALDPVKACIKAALTPIDKTFSPEEISKLTISGINGIGGLQTRGKYRDGAPKPRYKYKQGGDIHEV